MKKFLVVVGVLALVAVAAVVAAALFSKAKLEPLAEKILTDVQAGKVDAVYADASAAFRKDVTLEGFRRYLDVRARALGAFQKVAKFTGGGVSTSTDTGTTGNVSMDLTYAKGPATGEFHFVKEDDVWRLLHLKIAFDEKLLPAPDRAELEGRSRALLDLYSEAKFVALYDRFSKPLQEAWKPEQYEPQVRTLHTKAGRVVEAKLRDVKDGEQGKVVATFDVTFEKGPGDATLGWLARDGEWYLVAFDLHAGRR